MQLTVVEDWLVSLNVRGMAAMQAALVPGYLARAAALLWQPGQTVFIATGFPVGDTFETDGPAGALMMYRMLQRGGVRPVLLCAEPLARVLQPHYCCEVLPLWRQPGSVGPDGVALAARLLDLFQPAALVCIELAGPAADGRYYNMRGQDISARTADLAPLLHQLRCPLVGIGDGGNETGMAKLGQALTGLAIRSCVQSCTELIVADVSNWAAYGLALHWSLQSGQDLFADCDATAILQWLVTHGSVDGVTGQPTCTEDGFAPAVGAALCQKIYQLYQELRESGT